MIKKEMIAMLLAGGQGSRLGVLTAKVAKPAVAFGGKSRISGLIHILELVFRGIWTGISEGCQFFRRMRRVQAANGIQERRMQFIRIWSIWRHLIRIMY